MLDLQGNSVVQSFSHVRLCDPMDSEPIARVQSTLRFTENSYFEPQLGERGYNHPKSSLYLQRHMQSSPLFYQVVQARLSATKIIVALVQPLGCIWLCNLMNCSTPGFPVLHYLPELAQTHVHWVNDTIQPSHPLLPLSPAFNLSQHQGLFPWVSPSHQTAKVLELQLQHQSFQWIFRVDFLYDWLVWSPCCKRDSQEPFSSTTVWKHQFLSAQPSLWSNSHICTWLLEKP